MTRKQFLNNLYHRLEGLTPEQAEQHLTYYAEMLADRMEEGMTEEEAVAGMEDVDTIARRILEEEGLPYKPPVTPPVYPDAAKIPGGGGTKGYQPPKRPNSRKIASILAWTLAAVCVLGAVKRFFGRNTADLPYIVEEVPAFLSEEEDWVFAAERPPLDIDFLPDELSFYSDDWSVVGRYDIPADEVNQLQINWVSGVVDVQGWNGDFELLEYSATGRGKMTYTIDGEVLAVQANGSSGLLVRVPSGWLEDIEINTSSAAVRVENTDVDQLSVQTSSGSVVLRGLYASSLEATTVSGRIALHDLFADHLDLSTSSGSIEGSAHAEELDLYTISGDILLESSYVESVDGSSVSGNFLLTLSSGVEDISLQSSSGDVTLVLSEDVGFQLLFDTISGSVHEMDFRTNYMDGVYTHGDGSCEIDVSTTSGDVSLLR